MVENMLVSWDDMYNRIWLHYQDQIIFQVHKVLGSADFIGNPVGLFSSLSSGFGELFYEPYQGFIMSDRPQDLGIGIARVSTTMAHHSKTCELTGYSGCRWLHEEERFWFLGQHESLHGQYR